MLARPCFIVCALAWTAGTATAQQAAELKRGVKELGDLKVKFADDKKAVQKQTADKFDALITAVASRAKLSGAERVSLAKKWADEKERFLKYDELSADADLAPTGLQYGLKIHDKYKPVSKKYDALMKAALNAKEAVFAGELRDEKQTFDETHFSGRREFVKDVVWNGSRYDGNDAVVFRLRVGEVTGDVFKARAAQNFPVAKHPIYEIAGSIDGLWVKGVSTRQIQGKTGALSFEGVVLGKTMILGIGGINPQGRPVNGQVIVSK